MRQDASYIRSGIELLFSSFYLQKSTVVADNWLKDIVIIVSQIAFVFQIVLYLNVLLKLETQNLTSNALKKD